MAAAPLLGALHQAGVSPGAGTGFAGGLLLISGLLISGLLISGLQISGLPLPAGQLELQPLAAGPGGDFPGLLAGFRPPAVVAMPQLQRPVVQPSQIQQQARQGHRILAAGEGHQQRGPLRQQLRPAAQQLVQAQVVGAPALGRRGHGPNARGGRIEPLLSLVA